MSLVKCEDCGNPVSNRAEACPRCGMPPASKDRVKNKGVPIVSPWIVYILGSTGKLRLLLLFTALISGALGYLGFAITSWTLIYVATVIFSVSFFLSLALPSRKTGIAMFIASKVTMDIPQKIDDIVNDIAESRDL